MEKMENRVGIYVSPMRSPVILVVMPMYNAARYVGKAVDSILTQTYTDFQLVIIDDGSTDGSSEIVNRYTGKKVILWRQENSGPGAAMNRAVRYATGHDIKFIARMDADDISMDMRLDVLLGLLKKNLNAAACSSNSFYIDRETEEITGTSTVPARPFAIKWELRSGLRGMIQGATLFRTDALEEIGGYRSQFRLAEETDLFLRLSEKYDLVNSKDYLYKIRIDKGSLSMMDVRKNLLYHFYALECWRNRKAGRQEDSFDYFLEKSDWMRTFRIRHEEIVLKLWRSNIENRNFIHIFLASLIDPRRLVARLLREF